MKPPCQTHPHLLLVDDDRLVLATLGTGLRDAGFEVTTAESAEDAENLLCSGIRPDLAIIDVAMPGRGGLYLTQRLNELDHIPFVMLSAYSDASIVAQSSQYGALGYCVKPIEVAQLLPAISAALARANELQALRQTREQLQQALDGDRSINIAIGIVMMEFGLNREQAFAQLRDSARQQRRKLSEWARQVIRARETLNQTARVKKTPPRPLGGEGC